MLRLQEMDESLCPTLEFLTWMAFFCFKEDTAESRKWMEVVIRIISIEIEEAAKMQTLRIVYWKT